MYPPPPPPPSEGVRTHIVFGVDPIIVSIGIRRFLSALYVVNCWIDFDQFGLIFQVTTHQAHITMKSLVYSLSSEPMARF